MCAPDTHTCTDTTEHSLFACEACDHDADCQVNQYCVQMSFSNPSPGVVGNFCLWSKAAPLGPNGTCGSGSNPYSAERTVDSVDGENDVVVCSLDSTTCPGLKAYQTSPSGCVDASASSNAACGAEGFNDGLCRQDAATWKCTIPCDTSDDCKTGKTCTAEDICSF